MLGMFSSRDDDMMALYGSHDSVQAMKATLELAVEHHSKLTHCKKLFENVAVGDVASPPGGGGIGMGYASYTSASRSF
jgi:hypothetical protein